MPVLKGEARKVDIWADLAKQISDVLIQKYEIAKKVRTTNGHNLTEEIEPVIKKFVQKRIVICYFKCTGGE